MAVLWFLFACADPDDAWGRWRRACDLTEGVSSPWDLEGRGVGISTSCAAAIGDDLGMDWASFASEPHDIHFVNGPDDAVIAGAWVLAAADLGTWGAMKETMLPNEALAVYGESALGRRLGEDQPAGKVWVAWLLANVETVDRTGEESVAIAQYNAGSLHWVYSAAEIDADAGHGPLNPIMATGVLIHEATHGLGDPCDHEGSGTSVYDNDASCAFGAEARFLFGWSSHSLSDSWFDDVAYVLRVRCRTTMRDRQAFTACTEFGPFD